MKNIVVEYSEMDFAALQQFLTRPIYGPTEAHAIQSIGAAHEAALRRTQEAGEPHQ